MRQRPLTPALAGASGQEGRDLCPAFLVSAGLLETYAVRQTTTSASTNAMVHATTAAKPTRSARKECMRSMTASTTTLP